MESTGHRTRELKSRTQVYASFMHFASNPDKIALYVWLVFGKSKKDPNSSQSFGYLSFPKPNK